MVRTDFSGPASWERLRKVLATPNEDGFLSDIELVDDPCFAAETCAEARKLLPGDYRHPLLVLVDTVALGSLTGRSAAGPESVPGPMRTGGE